MSMKYKLETTKAFGGKRSLRAGIKRFAPLIVPERGHLAVAMAAMLVGSGATLVGPVIIGRAIDTYVRLKDSRGLLLSSVLLLADLPNRRGRQLYPNPHHGRRGTASAV